MLSTFITEELLKLKIGHSISITGIKQIVELATDYRLSEKAITEYLLNMQKNESTFFRIRNGLYGKYILRVK